MTDCPLLNTLWLESELFRTWAVKAFGKSPFATMARTQLHVHHTFGGKTRKDLPSNTITVCAAVHEFCHAHQTEGRIACLYWKISHKELDWPEINEAAGFSVPGWLESIVELKDNSFRPFQNSLMLAAAYWTCRTRPASTATGDTIEA